MNRELLTTEQVAERYGVKPDTLKSWRYWRKGPRFIKVGRRALYRLDDLLAYEARSAIETVDPADGRQ